MSSTDPHYVTFTVKELLQRVDERLMALDQKLDLRLVAIDERITHIERTQSERAHLIAEFARLVDDVQGLKTFRARFLPVGIVVAILATLGVVTDLYFRLVLL